MSASNDVPQIDEILGNPIRNELYKVIEKLTGSAHVNIHIEPGSKKGDNFMGEIFRVHFPSSTNNKNDVELTTLILKIAPKNPIRREKMSVRKLFIREITMYDKVLSYFNDFQISKSVDLKANGFYEFPNCYSTLDTELNESVFLEDLRPRQFEQISLRQEELTFEHVSHIMKVLGKFHAISFALKDQKPKEFEQLSNLVFEQYWTMLESEFRPIFGQLYENFIGYLREENRIDLVDKVKQFAGDDICDKVLKLASSDLAEPYAVICHGDVTTNNSMFRKDQHGKPIEVQIFDWQFCRFASPVTELVLYIICSTTKELRDEHYDQFLKIYHESLSDLLTRLGSDPQKLFPYEVMLEQFRKFGGYAVFVGALLLPMLCADIDNMPDMDEIAENKNLDSQNAFKTQSIEAQSAYNKRVTDLFDDIARYGYI